MHTTLRATAGGLASYQLRGKMDSTPVIASARVSRAASKKFLPKVSKQRACRIWRQKRQGRWLLRHGVHLGKHHDSGAVAGATALPNADQGTVFNGQESGLSGRRGWRIGQLWHGWVGACLWPGVLQ